MSNGWDASAAAWIELLGEDGDWGREFVLDPALRARLKGRYFPVALDVGCGEGRICRLLKKQGHTSEIIGVDPTAALIEAARQRDPGGDYRLGAAESLPFTEASFDLVVSCMALLDIPDYRGAISEMARVLKPGGILLAANMNSFVSPSAASWVKDETGRPLYFPVDHYLEEFSLWAEWSGMRIENWHRPLSAYMTAFLKEGLQLLHFDEPAAVGGDPARAARYRRVPWFVVMEWQRPR